MSAEKYRIFRQRRVINFMGIPVDILSKEEFVERMDELIQKGRQKGCSHAVFTANAQGVVYALRDPSYMKLFQRADLVHADGMSVVWGSRIFGTPLPEKLTTTDIIYPTAEMAAKKGYKFYFFGANSGIAEVAAQNLKKIYPKLTFVGCRNGYFKSEELNEVIKKINEAAPDVLWVGLGRPLQERWVIDNMKKLEVPVIKTCGGVFDFVSGRIRRAPKWVTEHGFEWLYRVYREPRRLWKRYLITNPSFVSHVLWYRFIYRK